MRKLASNPALTQLVPLGDLHLLKLAREIAADVQTLDVILKNHGIEEAEWEKIKESHSFQRLLKNAVEEWNSATNTPERVKVKAASLIEEFLPELNSRIHDPRENLNHKVEAAKLARDLAGLGARNVEATSVGERFSVTINLGDTGQQLRFEKEATPEVGPPTIEGEVVP